MIATWTSVKPGAGQIVVRLVEPTKHQPVGRRLQRLAISHKSTGDRSTVDTESVLRPERWGPSLGGHEGAGCAKGQKAGVRGF